MYLKNKASNLSAQLAFLRRNLVCSFDFRSIAEQFFSWMDIDSLLQQSLTISKNQFIFLLCAGWVFLVLVGPGLATFFLEECNGSVPTFRFLGPILDSIFGDQF